MPTIKGFSTKDPNAFKKINDALIASGKKGVLPIDATNWKSEVGSEMITGNEEEPVTETVPEIIEESPVLTDTIDEEKDDSEEETTEDNQESLEKESGDVGENNSIKLDEEEEE